MFKMYALPLVLLLLTSCQAGCPPSPWSIGSTGSTCTGPCANGKCTTDVPSTGTCLQGLTHNPATQKCERTCVEGAKDCVIAGQAECPPSPWSTDNSNDSTCTGPCANGKCTTDVPSTGTCLEGFTHNQDTKICERTCAEGAKDCVIADPGPNHGFGGGWK